jgi:hypothetical protein
MLNYILALDFWSAQKSQHLFPFCLKISEKMMLMLDTNERRRTWTQSDDNISSEPLDEVT